jgi:hypothetical protein
MQKVMSFMNTKILCFTLSLFITGTVFVFPSTVLACRAPRPSSTAMVSRAEMIVRAVAVDYDKAPVGDLRQLNEPGDAAIEFKVKEILKGENVPSTMILNGYLTGRDDFNDQPVPYDFVRPGGRGGSCSAYEYAQGAEFLLFLKRIDDKLTIRWYALAPTNEQLHSADDPWVVWVKEQLKSSESKPSSSSATVFEAFDFWRIHVPLISAIKSLDASRDSVFRKMPL